MSDATAGEYDVIVYNSDNTAAIVSQAATVTVIGGDALARLVNLSARAVAGTGENTMILGFVVRGSGAGDLLLRAVGPGLSGLGVTGFLSDPQLRVMSSSNTQVAANDDWSSSSSSGAASLATSAEMSQLGAFQLAPGSRDSAVFLRSPPNGLYTSVVSSGDNSTGVLLSEIYAGSVASQRLVNLSARARVGTGDNLLIGGFVISGNRPMTVLLRGVGPSLAGKGIAVPLINPKLALFNSTGAEIGNNDNWGQSTHLADLRAATLVTGAASLNEGSNDAALLATLPPGVYSAHVTSVDGSAGVALVEIYEVP